MKNQEYFDIVDENGNDIGRKELRSVVHETGLWHRSVHIYLYRVNNREIEMLVHLRAKDKDVYPNVWDTRIGGHVTSGANIEQTILGEAKEEVGLEINAGNIIKGKTRKHDKYPNREIIDVSFYEFEGEIGQLSFNDNEVQEIKWMTVDQIKNALNTEPENWSASLSEFLAVSDELKEKIKK